MVFWNVRTVMCERMVEVSYIFRWILGLCFSLSFVVRTVLAGSAHDAFGIRMRFKGSYLAVGRLLGIGWCSSLSANI